MMKIIKKFFLTIIIVVLVIIAVALFIFYYLTLPVSKESVPKDVVIENGMSVGDMAILLKDNDLIKNIDAFKILMKLKGSGNIYAAKYSLNENMSTYKIIEALEDGGSNNQQITMTFKEGLNIRAITKIITENTNNTEEDVMSTLKDSTYLNSLLEKYWFLTDSILNPNIYYSLEGYLYPDTYSFNSKDVSVQEIFDSMLDQMNTVLEPYKADIENSSYKIDQLLTIASLAELEGTDDDSRKGITQVFYNRLNEGMSLGSDVTTYYAFGIDMGDRDLTASELESSNPYNTRSTDMVGKLPVGPICSPSKSAIEAAIYPTKSDYLYFVADKNGKVYFTKTDEEHTAKVEELQENGLWFEW